ncbi:MAG: DUF4388 domain-containing protein [Pseudomonadota bacterium]
MKTSGTLAQTPLSELLRWVWEERFTGTLALARDDVKKSIVFENAKPISARSNVREEMLGSILLAEKMITPEQLAKSLEKTGGANPRRHGEALVSFGVLDANVLNEALHRQFLLRVYEVFLWPDGKFGFVSQVPQDVARINIPEGLLELCFRGLIEKHRSSGESQSLNPDVKPVLTGRQGFDISDLRLTGREIGLYRGINGVTDVKTLVSVSRLDETLARAMLLSLGDLRVLRLGDSDPGSEAQFLPRVRGAPKGDVSPNATSEFVGDVANRLGACEGQDYFGILGVPPEAGDENIKAVYFALAKKYHPDRIPAGVGPEMRKAVESYFARVTEAFATLNNAETRNEYKSKLSLKASGMDQDKVNAIVQSELEFQKGQVLIRKGDFQGALEHLHRAVKLYDREPEYFAYLGWAAFREAQKRSNPVGANKGKAFILAAVKEREKMPDAYYFLGIIEKTQGNFGQAKQYFEKTVAQAPRHNEANSELRYLNRKAEKLEPKPGGLKGFFRKKA